VAVESAGIVLVRNDPRDVVGVIQLSRTTYRKMIENLAWATGYNVVAIPIAAGLLVPWGIDLPMSVGAIAMSASTIIVAANAQLLRRQTLRHDSLTVSPPVTPKEESTVDEPILETSLQTQNRNSGHVAWR
jgi:P-type Cu2+ transporter